RERRSQSGADLQLVWLRVYSRDMAATEGIVPMSNFSERITINAEQCGGRPCIRGMRIRVADILDLYAAGLSAQEILDEMPDLEMDDLKAALKYAAQR